MENAADQTVWVKDHRGAAKPILKSTLREQFVLGNLSEKTLVCEKGTDFKAVVRFPWLLNVPSSSSSNIEEPLLLFPPTPSQQQISPPSSTSKIFSSPSQSTTPSSPAPPLLRRQGSFQKLKPKFMKSSSLLFHHHRGVDSKLETTTTTAPLPKVVLPSTSVVVGLSPLHPTLFSPEEDAEGVWGYSMEVLPLLQHEFQSSEKELSRQFASEVLQAEIQFLHNMSDLLASTKDPLTLAQSFLDQHQHVCAALSVFIDANQMKPSDGSQEVLKDGYLLKRSSNVRKDWKRRLFRILPDKLVYYRQKTMIVICDLALCTVRAKDKHQFEIITNTRRSLILMANSLEEQEAWISAIKRGIERSLSHPSSPPNELGVIPTSSSSSSLQCFDCHQEMDSPNWVSINLGIFVCIACSGLHRSLGSHVSKIRSLHLDTLPPTQLAILHHLGNREMAAIYGGGPNLSLVQKYVLKTSLLPQVGEDAITLEVALQRDNLPRVAYFVAHKSPPFGSFAHGKSALHVAAQFSSDFVCEYLLLNGADLSAMDDEMRTPSDVATERGDAKVQAVFRSWAANVGMLRGVITEDV